MASEVIYVKCTQYRCDSVRW